MCDCESSRANECDEAKWKRIIIKTNNSAMLILSCKQLISQIVCLFTTQARTLRSRSFGTWCCQWTCSLRVLSCPRSWTESAWTIYHSCCSCQQCTCRIRFPNRDCHPYQRTSQIVSLKDLSCIWLAGRLDSSASKWTFAHSHQPLLPHHVSATRAASTSRTNSCPDAIGWRPNSLLARHIAGESHSPQIHLSLLCRWASNSFCQSIPEYSFGAMNCSANWSSQTVITLSKRTVDA